MNKSDELINNAFNKYFNISKKDKDKSNSLYSDDYTYEQFKKNSKPVYSTLDIPKDNAVRYVAMNNISNINQFAKCLKKILNAAWGDNWGVFGPKFKENDNIDKLILPQITYNIYSREVAEKTSLKPTLTEYIKEVVNDKETGDSFAIYRQMFDCVVEFDIWATNTLELENVSDVFELLMSNYSWYFKKYGLSEIIFLNEIQPKESQNYIQGINMKPLLYFVRLERIQSIRTSILKNVNLKLNINKQ